MSLIDRVKGKAEKIKPRISECADLRPAASADRGREASAGDDFDFKVVFDPTDPHLVADRDSRAPRELPRRSSPRAESSSSAIHKPTDTAISKMWLLTYSPHPSEKKFGILPIQLAKDEAFLLDLWTHPDFRRQAVAFTMAYELGAVADVYFPADTGGCTGTPTRTTRPPDALMELIYGMWSVQEIKEVEIGDFYVGHGARIRQSQVRSVLQEGPSQRRRLPMPGRPRSGERYRDYHHKDGFARGVPDAVICERLVLERTGVVRQRPPDWTRTAVRQRSRPCRGRCRVPPTGGEQAS